MGIFDWLGPTSFGKRRGWDALPTPASPTPPPPETKATPWPRELVSGVYFTPSSLASPYGSGRDGSRNSAVYACLQTLASSIAEPELKVYRVSGGERVELPGTPLGARLAAPNPYLSLDTLLAYVSDSLHVAGNAYWRKIRAGDPVRGNVLELWPVAPSRVEPITRSGSGDFVSFYRYTDDAGRATDLAPENVVHFRLGLDDADHRLGSSPLKRLLAEISSDDQATRYADRLLANLAINGLSLSFDKEAPPIDQATADELKARITAAYGGDNVGSTAVLSPGAQLTALGFSPEQMDLEVLHHVPEARICAVLGVPAAMVGLNVGLAHSIYNNVKQAEEHFTERKLIPLWRSIAATITISLVPDFAGSQPLVVDFDLAAVRALADDQNTAAARLKTLVDAGILTENEARAEIGYPPLSMTSDAGGEPSAVSRQPSAARRPVLIADRSMLRAQSKAAEDLVPAYDAMRERVGPDWEADIREFLEGQSRRVQGRLRAGADTAGDLITEAEARLLGETLTPLQQRMLRDVTRLVIAELGVDFQLDDAETRAFLESAATRVVGITDTTRDAVRAALVEGQAAGEGIELLARRLASLPAFNRSRAETVARGELGYAQNESALAAYRSSGVVVGVRIHDGLDDDAACRAMDGRTFTLEQAPAALEHPRCVRAFAPITDSEELSRSA